MTSIFQALINFLDFILTPVYNVLYTVVVNYFYAFLSVLNTILYCLQTVVNGIIFGFFWIIDKCFVLSISGINALFGTTGILSGLSSTPTVAQIVQTGAVGITWIKNFVDFSRLTTPLFTYILFLLLWTVYKIVKSWIPFIGN